MDSFNSRPNPSLLLQDKEPVFRNSMPDLKEAFKKLEVANPKSNIAGFVENRILFYQTSANPHLPAALCLFDLQKKATGDIYTNLPSDHWLYTYTKDAKEEGDTSLVPVVNAPLKGVDEERPVGDRSFRLFAGAGPAGPLGDAGGLYQAAKSLESGASFYKDKAKVHTREKGLHRALRYYMLAAYALLGKCAKSNYTRGNYVCSLLVDDSGSILSWGVNNGWYRHGEVNMLLNYFVDRPAVTQLPANSIVFSTLTPCKQCSSFLQSARPKESIILMGQSDTGDFGKVGEAYGKYLRDLTDPVQSRTVTMKDNFVKVGEKVTKNAWNPKLNFVEPIMENQPIPQVNHYNIDAALTQQIKEGKIAEQIGANCKMQLIDSLDTLTRKFSKDRKPTEDLLDQKVKVAVLNYLNKWLGSVAIENRFKKM